MPAVSAGILLWRRRRELEVLLAHFGGPMWRNRDAGAWSIPKGLIEPGEQPEDCARREFEEETGLRPEGPLVPLGEIRQKGGKIVIAFALQGDFAPEALVSNLFTVEWPPRSRKFAAFPEIDRVAWFALPEAREKMLPSLIPLLDRLPEVLAA
jgi:predicted NUDIX family NTP pyrophosphohydrolase